MKTVSVQGKSALAATVVRMEYLLELVFDSTTVRLWSGYGDLSWNGQTWKGNGWFLSQAGVSTSRDGGTSSVGVVLSAIPSELLTLVLSESYNKNTGTLYAAIIDPDTDAVLDAPEEFSGYFETVDVVSSNTDASILITLESKLKRTTQQREERYSNASQVVEYPADKGFEYLEYIYQNRIYWGKPDTSRTVV